MRSSHEVAIASAAAASAAASANYYGYAPYPQYWPLPDGSNAVAAQAYAAAYAYPAAQQVQAAPGQYQTLGALAPQAGFQGGAPQVLAPTGVPQAYQAAYMYAFPSGDTATSPEEAAAAEGQYDV